MLSSEGSPDWLYRRAREHFVAGERDQAENYARRVLELKPQHEGSLRMLVAINQAKQQEEEARQKELLQQWADIVSRQRAAEDYFQQGLEQLAQHHPIEAEHAFREAIRLDAEHRPAREYVELFQREQAAPAPVPEEPSEIATAQATIPPLTEPPPRKHPWAAVILHYWNRLWHQGVL